MAPAQKEFFWGDPPQHGHLEKMFIFCEKSRRISHQFLKTLYHFSIAFFSLHPPFSSFFWGAPPLMPFFFRVPPHPLKNERSLISKWLTSFFENFTSFLRSQRVCEKMSSKCLAFAFQVNCQMSRVSSAFGVLFWGVSCLRRFDVGVVELLQGVILLRLQQTNSARCFRNWLLCKL